MAEQGKELMNLGEKDIKDLNTTQCDIAQLLHMAYNATKKQPKIATQIRMTAHLARTQRVESSALISRFALKARHVQETLIPLIFEGVELQIPSIITGGLEQALSLAEDMKTETEKARKQCRDIQTKVQEHMGQIHETSEDIVRRNAEIKVEKDEAKDLAKKADAEVKADNEVLKTIRKEGEEKRKRRERLQKDYDEKAAAISSRKDEEVIDSAIFQDKSIPAVKMTAKVTAGLVNLVGHDLHVDRKHVAVHQAADQVNKEENLIRDSERREQESIIDTQETKEQRMEKLYKFKKLSLEADVNAAGISSREDEKVLDNALFPDTAIPAVKMVAQVTAGLVNLASHGLNAVRKHVAVNQAAAQLNKEEELIRDNERRERELMMDTLKKQEQRIEQLYKFKKLCLEAETTGDVSGLFEASKRIGDVDKLLGQLMNFWNTMVQCITCLIDNTKTGKVFLGAIERKDVQQRFCLAIEKAKKGWGEFERICNWYHDVCEGDTANSNNHLYDFLSKPIENMSKEEIQDRQRAIADKIEADIKEAELSFRDA